MIFTRDEFTWISSWAEKGKKEQVKRSVIELMEYDTLNVQQWHGGRLDSHVDPGSSW